MHFIAVLLAACWAKPTSKVVDLTPDNFEEFVTGDKHALVEFYAPWCGHCKNLEPNYEKLAQGFAKHHSQVVIAKVNADEHKDLGKKFEVKGFPTILFFAKGGDVSQPEKYSGQRDPVSMATFLQEKTGLKGDVKPDVKYATQLGEHNWSRLVKKSQKPHLFLEVYSVNCAHCRNLDPIWQQLAKAFQAESSVLVAQIDAKKEADLLESEGVVATAFPTIKFLPKDKHDWSEAIDYTGGRDLESFVSFINEHAGTKRASDGTIADDAGILADMEPLLKAFFATTEKAKRAQHTKQAAAKKDSATKYYVKVMEKIEQQGTSFLSEEASRLSKLIADDSITAVKADEFKQRLNIIKQFAKHAGIDEMEDKADL